MQRLQVNQEMYNEEVERLNQVNKDIEIAHDRIRDAQKEGDLSENAQYEDARNNLELLETLAKQLRDRISNMEVVATTYGASTVGIPSKFIVEDIQDGKEMTLTLQNRGNPPDVVSSGSKFGQLILGKRVGDVISYTDNAFVQRSFKLVKILWS